MPTTETYNVANPAKPTIAKDPNAVLDYSWDWTDWLAPMTDAISSFTVLASSGLTVVSSAVDAGIVSAFLSGGVLGAVETATCRIVTTGGRTDDRTIYLRIVER